MSASEKNKKEESLKYLIKESSFIQWVIQPTAELDAYWHEESEKYQALNINIFDLKNRIHNLKVKEPQLSVNERNEVWNKIKSETLSKRSKLNRLRLYLTTAAAIAAILIISVKLWDSHQLSVPKYDYSSMMTNDKRLLQSSNVSIVISEDKKIDIKSDSTNIVYNSKGALNIEDKSLIEESNNKEELNQLIVPYGKKANLTLSDGTKVWINSGSKLIYPSVFDKDKREIFVSGEIFLDVAKKGKLPFIVRTDQIDIRVHGTQFNVSSYSNDNFHSVVLVSGLVTVNSKETKDKFEMKPNEMFTYSKIEKDTYTQAVDVNNYVSWVDGYLLLKNESLDKLILRLERHYNLSFTYNLDEVKKIKVSGKLDLSEKIENVLNNICLTASVKYVVVDKNIHIMTK